ncbi:MAG: MarR family transcriptional regulator [Saprospiraceae bacterium]|nr:MarR family transcriptional regulator [Saprospiraceae bacterium]
MEIITNKIKQPEISGFTMEKTVKLMKLSFSRILMMHPEIDITVDQWIIIQLLFKHKNLSQQQLAELSFKDAPTVTRIIDILVNKDIVLRETDNSDRRKFSILLTESGHCIYQMVIPILDEFRREAYAGIPHTDLIVLEGIMNKIFENLSKQN